MVQRPPPAAALALLALAALPGAARAGNLEGSLSLNMEYLGQTYFSEQRLSAEELGLPAGSSLLVTDTTRFHDDTWLPGPRLECRWRSGVPEAAFLELGTRTELNAEVFSQEITMRGARGASGRRWTFRGTGSVREEERSLVGHGDWRGLLEVGREERLGDVGAAALAVSAERARTRGDTTSYLYDFDFFRARAALTGGDGWLPAWEAFAEGAVKRVPEGDAGSYQEMRLGGSWLPAGGFRHLAELELRWRDYGADSVGRDQRSVHASTRDRVAGGDAAGLDLETETEWIDYDGSDALYFDTAELTLRLPISFLGAAWSGSAGPALDALWDLDGGTRDYRQWTLRTSVGRTLSRGAFAEVRAEGGRRDYRASDAEVVEVSSLSASLVRSDYWLLDFLALANLDMGARISLDLLASATWEFHAQDAEKIHVSFVTLGLTRRF